MQFFSTERPYYPTWWSTTKKSSKRWLKSAPLLVLGLTLSSSQAAFATWWGSYSRCDLKVSQLTGFPNNNEVTLGSVLDIEALIQGQKTIGKVKFKLKDARFNTLDTHTESYFPYYYLGDSNGQPYGWGVDDLATGDYWMSASVYDTRGNRCDTSKVPFTVVAADNDPPADEGFGGKCKINGNYIDVVGKLEFPIDFNAQNATAVVRNDSNSDQTVTLVAYKEYYAHPNFDDVYDNGQLIKQGQDVFEYVTETIHPGQTLNLQVPLPGCSTQIDLVCGDVIEYLGDGNLYGERKLAWHHAHETVNGTEQWCQIPEPVCDLAINELSGFPANGEVGAGEVLDIQALIDGQDTIKKVVFELQDTQGNPLSTPHTENYSPYYYLGDSSGQPNGWSVDLAPGDYQMTAAVYDTQDQVCHTDTKPFTVKPDVCDLAINELDGFPKDGVVTAGDTLNIKAIVNGQDTIRKVVFELQDADGGFINTHTENYSPYYYLGDSNGQPRGWLVNNLAAGDYKMVATVYDTQEQVCNNIESDFTVVQDDGDEGFGQKCKVNGVELNVVGKLNQPISFDSQTATAVVRNHSNVEQEVTLVAYEEYYPHPNYSHVYDDDGNLVESGQTVFHYVTQMIPANGEVDLEINLPGCSTQIDLVCGPVIEYLGDGLYGARKLDWYHAHEETGGTTQWCEETPPACDLSIGELTGFPENGEVFLGSLLDIEATVNGQDTVQKVEFQLKDDQGNVLDTYVDDTAPYLYQDGQWDPTGLEVDKTYQLVATVYDMQGQACGELSVSFVVKEQPQVCDLSIGELTGFPENSEVFLGSLLDIEATVNGQDTVQKVEFQLKDDQGNVLDTYVDDTAPYLYQDGQWDPTGLEVDKTYQLVATVYDMQGQACGELSVSFVVKEQPEVCDLTLSALTGFPNDDQVIPGTTLAIQAIVNGEDVVGGVAFTLKDSQGNEMGGLSYVDNEAPYYYQGDQNGAPNGWLVNLAATEPNESYSLIASVFDETGTACGELEHPFAVVEKQCDIIYAVHDQDKNDTEFLTIDLENGYTVQPLGTQYAAHDIEGLAIDLLTGKMYGSSGDDAEEGNPNGYLYEVSRDNGDLTKLGSVIPAGGYPLAVNIPRFSGQEVSAIDFHPFTGDLWGWVEGVGLITIDTAENEPSLPVNYQLGSSVLYSSDSSIESGGNGVEEITWTLDGSALYASANGSLYRYDPLLMTVEFACTLPGQVEAMAIMAGGQYQGTLWLSEHNSATLDIRAYDPVACTYLPEAQYPPISVAVGSYNDIEGIAWYCE